MLDPGCVKNLWKSWPRPIAGHDLDLGNMLKESVSTALAPAPKDSGGLGATPKGGPASLASGDARVESDPWF